ncbi:carboxypeptidase regulatory-like domain-containing protein [Muricauda sp. 2012CJ35-5]|uniref:Carboxypeptidase regulatory-like domain-containing protein n=1 Tax=Flagellimonas spongiicola TaxID=2942208 RepID=A0ABT0PTJ5_9FLAO|nr:carboxypeptidase regulatory-like domain-containing protein [Allomuricauda spongiicola]MCL6274301.1 carboxypeptidase regulatory-like domain-containing protein [Allomuricauda spongiicola]
MKNSILLAALLWAAISYTQETTGKLEGKIMTPDGAPLEFANIVVTDSETNFKFGAVSQESGYYSVLNIPPGNAYTIMVSFLGYQSVSLKAVSINLSEITHQDFILNEQGETLDEVVVIASENAPSEFEQTINSEALKNTPTITRSIQDLTRNLPEANLNSFAGASNRFNNLNIDGVANNDVIGFQEPSSGAAGSSANGSPGSLARTQPIGFGAIKQLSVKTTPFDVSIGNFSGANLDVVTKNGTNAGETEVYAYGNNQALVGRYADGTEQNVQSFYDFQVGFSKGGAIKKDKLFYFVNFEQATSNNPVLNAPGSSSSNISVETINQIVDKLQTDYNYDPGTFTDAALKTNSTKLFLRFDFNISDRTKLTLRNNYVNSFADNLEWNESIFNFGNQGFRHNSVANSFTAELKSNFKNSSSNLLSIGYNYGKEGRDFDGEVFPHLQISDASNRIFAGTYREASVYNTKLNTLQISDKFTLFKNKHTFTFGGLAQYNDIDYGFLSAWNGRWEYSSVDNFLNDRPSRIRGVYRLNDNNFDFVQSTPSATVDILVAGLYAQDRFRFSDRLSLNFGLRLDSQFLLNDIPLSDEVTRTPEFSQFSNKIRTAPHINPRFGFEYAFDEDRTLKLHGGTGLFTGRLPYLWFAYAEYISGTQYFNVDVRPDGVQTIVNDVSDLAGDSPIAEINLVDNDFELPRDWKSNIGLNVQLPNNYDLTFDASYTKVLKGIFFQSINRRDNQGTFDGADNRSYFLETGDAIKINPNFTNVFLLTNSDNGFRYNLTLGLSKSAFNYNGYVGYTFGRSKDISSTVRSSPAANYEWNQSITPNAPSLSASNFDLRHRFVSTHTYGFDLGKTGKLEFSALYNGTSGSPFSFVYQGDVNRDGSSRNDLIYIPRDASEINLIPIEDGNGNITQTAAQQWERLNAFIEGNDYLRSNRGGYAERNESKTPWNHRLDAKLAYNLNLKGSKQLRFSMDIFNVFNLINRDWGRLVFVPNVVNSNFSLLRLRGIENNQPQFQYSNTDATPWVVDNQNSRWRMQFGASYRF